ncbi:MAG: aspartyl/glutamyl-tRNA amidotransferase subunit A, partial [Leptospiraceae bacterium]|nr:aspartyl/glutamyl-tRNA amidotransferase subunit A [Leptospiraceae bacterium]
MSLASETILRSAREHARALRDGEYSAEDLAHACLARADQMQDLGAFLRLNAEAILEQARASDNRRAQGRTLGELDGIPVAVKDNICEKGIVTSCASRILENFESPYDATVIEKLKATGAVLFGRTNMDEFAMGSSTENSAFQNARNPWNTECVPGGSSGGSAVAVAAGITPLALGSDTGGSIRQPAAFCGVVGLKPTYGRVSRFGLVAYASSLDQIGPFARNIDDAALLLAAINGHDRRDSTSHPDAEKHKIQFKPKTMSAADWKKLRVGVLLPEKGAAGYDADVIAAGSKLRAELESKGASIVPLRSAYQDSVIPIYYILATAEASSNLSRYDGVRYGQRAPEPENLMDLYVR